MAHILVASLGDSPVVVTAMYDLLTNQQGLSIEKVIVLHPSGSLIPLGFDCIEEALKGKCAVEAVHLPFEDANSEEQCYTFLHYLYCLFTEAQENGDTVYLSLAGGRKSMLAIMALLVPLFPCVKQLYHILDKNEDSSRKRSFKVIEELMDMALENRNLYFFPPRDRLKLVKIPYGKQQQAVIFVIASMV